LGVSAVAAYLALNPDETILGLVANAWAGFGAAFGPVIILSLVWSKLTYHGAVSAMIAGAVTVLWWSSSSLTINDQVLSSWLYEIVPGFIVAMLAALIISRFTAQPSHNIDHFFSTR
jgi:SSS family solute:Na+ symporter/sodium/proline symporter